MSLDRPFFSTVICNYNYGEFLAEAVRSVLEQDYPAERREVIVVDDGSTDDSRAVLAGFTGRADVRIVEQANAGQAAAIVRGVELARGDYVCLLDSDDRFRPAKLDRVARHLARVHRPGTDRLLFHDYAIVDTQRWAELVPSWFASRNHRAPRSDIGVPTDPVFIPIPCGQVFSRELIQRLARGLPTPDHRRGVDVTLGYGGYLLAGRIDYLHEVLATYCVHGGNEFAAFEGDRWAPSFTTWHRWPKYLWYLEALMGTLEGTAEERIERLAFIKRLERDRQSVSSAQGFRAPRLDVIVDAAGANPARAAATVAGVTAQVRIERNTIVLGAPAGAAIPAGDARAIDTRPDAGALARMAEGYRAGAGEFVAFLAAGERPDPTFGERLVHVLQYDVPALSACCDYRIVDPADVVLHAASMLRSGAWEMKHVAVTPFSSYLADPVLPPLATAVLRRSRFLDHFFAPAAVARPGVPDAIAGWVLLLYAQALGPLRRLPQVLVTRRVPDAIDVLPPGPLGGAPTRADCAAAARYLLTVYCAARDDFRRRYSEQWHAQFIAWLMHEQEPGTAAALRGIATEHGDTDSADLIDAIVEIAGAGA
jgi:glycosyltransferase involved in cell wall biosynthesis